MQWLHECLYCGGFLYRLSDGRLKCSRCHKKISVNKTNKTLFLIEAFVKNTSAMQASKQLGITYPAVKKVYDQLRILAAQIVERHYEGVRNRPCEYEEYFYIEKSKRDKKEYVFDAQNFLTFDYEGFIYTILLPSLHKYKKQFLNDSLEDIYIDEFHKFKRVSRLIKVTKKYNNIVEFWNYFEEHIVLYKGVSRDAFAYYLKEFEFKYNYPYEKAVELLIKEYFQ